MIRRPCWAVLPVLLMLAAGCRHPRPVPAPAPPPPASVEVPPPPPPPPPVPTAPPPRVLSEEEQFARKTLADLNAERPLGDVFFDLDRSVLRFDDLGVLRKNADWLLRWPSVRLTIEGHCDSRGTEEYNIGLGDRRASAVRDYLISLGVPADRVTTVSKGEEQPFCREESESCWQQNRRGHFVIVAK